MEDGHAGGGGPTIIIKRVKKGGHGHHGGAWKVAYADMVTALMALFIVLWILSQSDEVTRAVAGYFRDPVGFVTGGQPSIAEGGSTAGGIAVLEGTQPESRSSPLDKADPNEKQWRERARSIMVALTTSEDFSKYRQQVELAMTPDGLSITLIESTESPLFKVGGTELNPDAEKLLGAIAEQIKPLENHISIEGHTDGRASRQADDANWELSTGRAHTARRVLQAGGIDARRFWEVRGMADNLLYNPLDPEDSRNRRVSITLLSAEAYDRRRRELETSVLSDELSDAK